MYAVASFIARSVSIKIAEIQIFPAKTAHLTTRQAALHLCTCQYALSSRIEVESFKFSYVY